MMQDLLGQHFCQHRLTHHFCCDTRMSVVLLLCLVLSVPCHSSLTRPNVSKKILTFGGIFDMVTKVKADNSSNMIPAVKMAIKHVNENPDILTDYQIELDIKDVKCSDAYSIKALIEYIKEEKQKIMVIGSSCAESAEPFAKAVHFYNLIQISMANANPSLGCKKIYKTFVRTVPPEHYQNMGRLRLIQSLDWKNVAVLQESLDTYLGLSNDLVTRLKKANITVLAHETLSDDVTIALQNVRSKDARIMFGLFRETTARQVICQAYKLSLCGPKYVWILMSGGYHEQWWNVNDTSCTPEQIKEGLGPYFGTKALLHDGTNFDTVAGKTIRELEEEYLDEISRGAYHEPHVYAPFAYDAVWTAALSLNKSLSLLNTRNETRGMTLDNFTYDNEVMMKLFLKSLRYVRFYGMSGKIIFDKKYERLGTLHLEQRQGDQMVTIGSFCMTSKKLSFNKNTKILWQGPKKPICKRKLLHVAQHINQSVLYFMLSLCGLGIVMAGVFLIFNIKYRDVRYIKMSSPRLNNIILTGCILIYASGILAGIDGQFVSEYIQGNLCQIQAWLVSTGFTLAFGALFSKTWRVHVIFLNKTEKKVIKDSQLFGLVFAFLLIDFFILVTWHYLDPMIVTTINMKPQALEGGDLFLVPYHCQCTSQHLIIFTGVLYGYKGFLLLFGTCLAWETRKVTIPVLNDSKLIGIAVYNVVIPCALVIPVLYIIKGNVSAIYGMTSLLCILCTTVTQCLIFVPKVVYICQNKQASDDASNFSTIPRKTINTSPSLNNSASECSTATHVTMTAREDAYSFKPVKEVTNTTPTSPTKTDNNEDNKPEKNDNDKTSGLDQP